MAKRYGKAGERVMPWSDRAIDWIDKAAELIDRGYGMVARALGKKEQGPRPMTMTCPHCGGVLTVHPLDAETLEEAKSLGLRCPCGKSNCPIRF
jgi:predicted alpha-1,6-mannanase (GH76 family)